jgi:putative aldouronate transport system permease protein
MVKQQTFKKQQNYYKRKYLASNLKRNWTLYTMVLPGVILIFIFSYIPIYGIVMAFQNFSPGLGFFRSPWAQPWYGHFVHMFKDYYFGRIMTNTLKLSIYGLLWGFPAPIVLALLFNEMKHKGYKRVAQTISYMPYFLSVVIIVGILKILFASEGPIVSLATFFGNDMGNIFMDPHAFRTLYITSGIWTSVGYNSIIYLAAIAGINPELYESAVIDGANRLQQVRYITLPAMVPTITILLILSVSGIINNDYQKILLMYNPAIYSTSDVIGTYVYRMGISGDAGTGGTGIINQSYAAAVGLFQSVVSFLLLGIANLFARHVGETSLW